MKITRSGTQPSAKGPADWFTGTVRIDPLFSAPAPARVAGAAGTVEPGACPAGHTHPHLDLRLDAGREPNHQPQAQSQLP